QPVMAVWEGSGNVIALDVLRAVAREPESLAAFDAEVSLARGADTRLDAHLDTTRHLIAAVAADPVPDAHARRLVAALALALQASLLARFAPGPVADAFTATRLRDAASAGLYGVLPQGADAPGIAARI